MKQYGLLTVTSLLALLLLTFHLADDVVRGFADGGRVNLIGIAVMVVWLYGALVLAEKLSGHVIMLLGGVLGVYVSYLHMTGRGMVGGRIAGTAGMRFWVWTMIAGGALSGFSVILALRGMWALRTDRSPST